MTTAMSAVLERLTAAGWVDRSFVSDEKLKLHWTPEGLAKAAALREAIDALDLFDLGAEELACLVMLLGKTLPDSAGNPVAHRGEIR